MNITLAFEEDLPTPFALILANPDRILSCLPRIDHTEALDNGQVRVVMQSISFTPFIQCTPIGLVQIQRQGEALLWIPARCELSNGQLQGSATANADGSTHLQVQLTIQEPRLPQVWSPLLTALVRHWSRQLLAEFHDHWMALPPIA